MTCLTGLRVSGVALIAIAFFSNLLKLPSAIILFRLRFRRSGCLALLGLEQTLTLLPNSLPLEIADFPLKWDTSRPLSEQVLQSEKHE
jgi:hypothetical protein